MVWDGRVEASNNYASTLVDELVFMAGEIEQGRGDSESLAARALDMMDDPDITPEHKKKLKSIAQSVLKSAREKRSQQ